MDTRLTDTALTLLSPAEVWDRVDPLASEIGVEPSSAGLGALPYAQLQGPGFERLCYELLVAEGHSPRFFGRSGQRDYGVDIIVEAGDIRTLHQCKNLTIAPSWTEVRDAVTKFESDWLDKAGLPRPNAFVYCCPHPLDDVNLGRKWIRFKDDFRQRTGVNIDFKDKRALDTRLRRLPDIVGGMFSGSYTEHFCNRDDWMDAPWTRVHWGEARHASIIRFLDRHRQEAIHIAETDEKHFQEILSGSSVLVIRGLPGSGKTLTGLELACGLRAPLRRIYYATFKDAPDPQRLWQSVNRRRSLPAVLLLDDCHLNLEQTGLVLERLRPELSDPKGVVKLILVLRDLPGSTSGKMVDTPGWLVQLDQDGLVLDMKTDLARTRAVTVHLRPELTGLSEQRLEHLHHLSAGDLLLLDEILHGIESPQDLDTMDPHRLYGSLRTQYFDGNRRLPTVQRLACLAQFELTPVTSFLDDGWLAGEKNLVASLMTELFAPPRYQFLHSSLAEMVLRALLALEMEAGQEEAAVVETTATELIAYFRHVAAPGTGDASRDTAFMRDMEILLRTHLKRTESSAEAQIKARLLNEEFIMDGIEERLHECSFTFLHICLVILNSASHPAKGFYAELVERRFHILFKNAHDGQDSAGMATVGTGFMTLARNTPSNLAAVQNAFGAGRFLGLIIANGTLFELFKILEHATPAFREELLGLLDQAGAGELIDKTIAAGQSIGTLHLAMRELGDTDEALLGRLEQTIGAGRFLGLIIANGTLFELFKILEHATPAFREELLGLLDQDSAGELIDKTIAAGRSIGTLNLAMRELGDDDEALLGRLEQTIGAGRFLRLIIANGTLFELFHILRYATPAFREELLGQLDQAGAGQLIDKTIAAGRSIESFHHTLRQLSLRSNQRERLEKLLGIIGWWQLLAEVGTLNSLIRITRAMSREFRKELLEASSDLGVADWQNIIAHGLFLNACTFANEELAAYPEPSQTAFRKALDGTAAHLAAKATWFDLNPSRLPADPNSPERQILQAALRPRIEGIRPKDLLDLDFHEAVNGLAFVWRERPDLRPTLASQLWEILPEPAYWPQEEGKVASLRLVLIIVRSELIAVGDVHRLLEGIHGFLTPSVCAEIHTWPLFLLLWNECAVHYEREIEGIPSFEGALPDSLTQTLLEILRQRVAPKGPNKEKLAQLALAGLISLLIPRQAKVLRKILMPLTNITRWLYPEALELTFVPALFALKGIALLKPSEPVFTPFVRADLLAKSEEYEDIGPAIELLRQQVAQNQCK